MSSEKEVPIYKEESQQIIGCAMEVHNVLGFGFHEKPYERALVVEFESRGIPYQQQKKFELIYKTKNVGDYIPDLIAFKKIIIVTKVIPKITDNEIGKMMNYLKITGLRLGYIINFKNSKLEWKRVIR
jgi:GxxExxY protein